MTILNLSTTEASAAAPPIATGQPVVADASGVITVTDKRGRVIRAKMLKAFDRMRLFKTIGGELAGNAPYFGYAVIAASVVEIAGDPVSFPITQSQLEALVARLDDDGLDAVSKGLADTMVANDESVADTAKN